MDFRPGMHARATSWLDMRRLANAGFFRPTSPALVYTPNQAPDASDSSEDGSPCTKDTSSSYCYKVVEDIPSALTVSIIMQGSEVVNLRVGSHVYTTIDKNGVPPILAECMDLTRVRTTLPRLRADEFHDAFQIIAVGQFYGWRPHELTKDAERRAHFALSDLIVDQVVRPFEELRRLCNAYGMPILPSLDISYLASGRDVLDRWTERLLQNPDGYHPRGTTLKQRVLYPPIRRVTIREVYSLYNAGVVAFAPSVLVSVPDAVLPGPSPTPLMTMEDADEHAPQRKVKTSSIAYDPETKRLKVSLTLARSSPSTAVTSKDSAEAEEARLFAARVGRVLTLKFIAMVVRSRRIVNPSDDFTTGSPDMLSLMKDCALYSFKHQNPGHWEAASNVARTMAEKVLDILCQKRVQELPKLLRHPAIQAFLNKRMPASVSDDDADDDDSDDDDDDEETSMDDD